MSEPTRGVLLAYALPALPLAVLTLPLYVVVPQYYAEGLGLPLAVVGQALLLVRLIDAIADPVVGIVADRYRPRFGRRRLWLLLATPFTAVAAAMLFTPGSSASALYLFVWGALLSVASTATLVPYTAWGAELSTSYRGRSRVAAYREVVIVVGTVLAILATALVPQFGLGGDREVLAIFAAFVGIGLPIAVLVLVVGVAEPRDRSRRTVEFREGLRYLAANAPFRRLISAFLANGLANGLPATLFLFYVAEKLAAPVWRGPLLLIYFLAGMIGVPAWLALAARIGKHRAWCWAMLLSCSAFVVAPFLGPGDAPIFAAICVITGLALGADLVLPASLQADVIDIDTARSGAQRSGLYLALWSLATKLALALAVGIAFPLLAWSGFDPAAHLVTAAGLAMLGTLYAGVPVVLKLLAIALMWRFPLDREEQAALAASIEDQSALPRQPVALATSGK